MYKEDDIVVRIEIPFQNCVPGDIRKIKEVIRDHIKLVENISSEQYDSEYFRLATQEETEAYNLGCRNISELDNYINSNNRLNELPDKWCIKTNKNTRKIINDFLKGKGYTTTLSEDYYCHFPFTENGGSAYSVIKENYIEITFQQFEELVLNKTNKQQINNKTNEQESNSSNIIKAKRPITTIRQGQRITGSRICGKQSRIAITSRSISYKTVIS